MSWFDKFVVALQKRMTTPVNFGWFHLMFVGIIIVSTVLICIFGKNVKSKTFRIIIMTGWIVILLFEIYKQVVFAANYDGTKVTWKYEWNTFPFQFCSSPLYILPIIAFAKEGKFRDASMAFMSTFALFAGLAVYAYPNDVFIRIIGVNIQTMIHHGLQIVFGIYILVYNRKKLKWKYFLSGAIVFVVMCILALLLNIIVNYTVVANTDIVFNMFYISPYTPCTLPVLDKIYLATPYIIFFITYVVGFFIIGALIFAIEYYVIKLCVNDTTKTKRTN